VTSAGTSATGPMAPPTAKAEQTEAEYLADQSRAAQAAMRAALGDLQKGLAKGLNPLRWTKDHPWLTLGAIAIGGFATSAAVVPSREEQELRKLRRLHEAMRPPAPAAAESHPSNGNAAGKSTGGLGRLLLRELIGLVRPIMAAILSEALGARSTPPPPAPPAGGAAAPPPPPR
jgi:hypothetical protein